VHGTVNDAGIYKRPYPLIQIGKSVVLPTQPPYFVAPIQSKNNDADYNSAKDIKNLAKLNIP